MRCPAPVRRITSTLCAFCARVAYSRSTSLGSDRGGRGGELFLLRALFVFSLFFQAVQQLSPQQTGLAFLPVTAILMVMNIVAGRLVTRVGLRALMVAGLALASFGYLLLLRVDADRSYLTLVLPMLLAASGIALVVPTMTNATLSAVDAAATTRFFFDAPSHWTIQRHDVDGACRQGHHGATWPMPDQAAPVETNRPSPD
ncbi:hypothetical protein [Variovorax sp.]|uniref:hypothetical protein n=1 Tax=Variovorax sp. TaxID=1871043 RepID=UPI003BA99204